MEDLRIRLRHLVGSLLPPFQQLDGPAQERLSVVGRQTMLKDYGHGTPWDLTSTGIVVCRVETIRGAILE